MKKLWYVDYSTRYGNFNFNELVINYLPFTPEKFNIMRHAFLGDFMDTLYIVYVIEFWNY